MQAPLPAVSCRPRPSGPANGRPDLAPPLLQPHLTPPCAPPRLSALAPHVPRLAGPGELSLILQEPAWSHVFSLRRAGRSCPGVAEAFHSQPVRAPATRPWTQGLCHLFHPHPGVLCSPQFKDEESGVWRGRLTCLESECIYSLA